MFEVGIPWPISTKQKKLLGEAKLIVSFLWYLGSRISTCVIWIYSLYGSSKYSNNLSEKLDLSSGTRNPQSFPSEQNLQMSLDKIFSREKSQTWQGKSTLGTKVFLAEPDQAFLHLHLQCILSNVSKTVLLTRSSVVVTLRTVRASTTKCRSGTRQAMLLSSSASWPWFWDSGGSWGLSWQSWFPWGWCGFGLVALARFSRSNLPRNVSNSDNQGEEPPPWTNQIKDSITKTFHDG